MKESLYREVVCRWLRRAQEDLVVAEDELGNITWASVFHSQQAAEKALKALLIALGMRPPRTHRIELLIELIKRSGIEVGELQRRGLEKLSSYAVEARYPDFEEEPTTDEAATALHAAEFAVSWVKGKLGELGINC